MAKKQYSDYWLDNDLFDVDEDDGFESLIDVDEDDEREKNAINLENIIRLAAVRRAIGNFVSILSGKNIPVVFSRGQKSYTDGEQVVISADPDPKKFDVMVGLALHEGSHVLLSDFGFVKEVASVGEAIAMHRIPTQWNAFYFPVSETDVDPVLSRLLHPDLYAILPKPPKSNTGATTETREEYISHKYWGVMTAVLGHLHTICNMLEDRRIDKYVYVNAPGYRPYYDSLYKKYFFSPEIGKNLKFNPNWREITVDNYINRLLMLFHPDASIDAMPGLDRLTKLVDLDTIERISNDPLIIRNLPDGTTEEVPVWKTKLEYYSLPTLWKEANVLLLHMLKYATIRRNQKMSGGQEMDNTSDEDGDESQPQSLEDMLGDALYGLPNMDIQDMDMTPRDVEKTKGGKEGKYNESRAKKNMNAAKKVASSGVKKRNISDSMSNSVSAYEAADARMVDMGGDGIPHANCMVIRKITPAVLKEPWFIFTDAYNSRSQELEKAVVAGKRMGQILVHRLQVRNDPLVTRQTRLPKGHIDRRLLAQLGMDLDSVFYKTRTDLHKPAMLHLTIDASGSMGGTKWTNVMTVATALAYAGSKIPNIDTVISIRGGDRMPVVAVIFDSRRDQFSNYLKIATNIGPHGATPESLCFKATMDLILEATNTHQVYFINFSDGEPVFSFTGTDDRGQSTYFPFYGEVAINHTKRMMQLLKDNGVKILSYFISAWPVNEKLKFGSGTRSEDTFKRMYGEDAVFVSVTNAAEVVRTLNKTLIIRG